MAGVLFIVNVPQRKYEEECRRKDKSTKINIENNNRDKYKLYDEDTENKNEQNGNVASHVGKNVILEKCRSTDCLNYKRENGLFKCHSENVLSVNKTTINMDPERKSYLKSSLEAIIPKKNKLKITNPEQVDILTTFRWDTPLETILSEVIFRLGIKNAAWISTEGENFWQVTFSLESSNLCEELLQVLRTFGIGSRLHSSVSVIPCALYYKSQTLDTAGFTGYQSDANSAWSRFSSSMRARNNLTQILHNVRAEAALTFDWLFLLIVAAFVAAIGLVENSTVILVASMLISPLMGPITAGTLGTAVRERSLQQMGVIHELIGLFLSTVIGFIFGLAICAVDERYGVGDWPTYEMMSRCEIRSLWVGVLVAIPSGAGVALAVLGEYTASLVGVAISASLLPPAVNAGLLWAMALVHLVFMDDDKRWTSVVKTTIYSTNQPTELAVLGTVSLCLTLVNIVCIFVAGVAVYKVKKVCPLERRNLSWWRNNKHNLKTNKNADLNGGGTNFSWDIYSKWCNNTEELDSEKTVTRKITTIPKDNVDSDTVTYRKPQPHTKLRMQVLEDFGVRRAELAETYMAVDNEQYSNNSVDKESLEIPNSKDVKKENEKNQEKNKQYADSNIDFNFHNMGFEAFEDSLNLSIADVNKTVEPPTIIPSSTYTANNKKYGIVMLGDKAYHV